jgi:hypothetical protein
MRKGRLPKAALSSSSSSSSSSSRRRRTIENFLLRILIVALLMSIIAHRKHSKQLSSEAEVMYRGGENNNNNNNNNVDDAILDDLEIGEYQDMEMHEMRSKEDDAKKKRRIEGDADDVNNDARFVENEQKKVMSGREKEEDEDEDERGGGGGGGGGGGPLIQNPTSMTNLATQIAMPPFNYRVDDLFLTVENHKRLQPRDRIRFPSKNLPASAPYGGGGDSSTTESNNDPSMKFYRTCAVVLNSGVLTTFGDRKQGERIDAHDAVFRVNQAPTKYFERFVGKKTTLRVLNRKWTQIFNQKMGKGFLFADPAGASFVVTRARTTEFEHLAATVRKERDGDVKVFSMAHGVATRARWTLRAFREGLIKLRPSKRKKYRDLSTGLSPSSGFIAIYIARHLCGKVAVYGMSLERSWEGDTLRAPYHYFTTMDGRHSVMDSIQLRAHESHAFDLEGELVKTWSEAGILRLCDPGIKRDRLCQVYEDD